MKTRVRHPTLSALAVSGDAFLLDDGERIILVDGGRTPHLLAKALVEHRPRLRHIDVVVCSHADVDHAGGLFKFPEEWSKRCGKPVSVGEFWLPGRWRSVVSEGLRDPKKLVDAMIGDIDAFDYGTSDRWTIEAKDLRARVIQEAEAKDPPLSSCGFDFEGAHASCAAPGSATSSGSISPGSGGIHAAIELHGFSTRCGSRREEDERTRLGIEAVCLVNTTEAMVTVDVSMGSRSSTKAKRLRNGRLVARPVIHGANWEPEVGASEEPEWLKELEGAAERILREGSDFDHQIDLGRRRIGYRDRSPSTLPGGRPSQAIALGPKAAEYWRSLVEASDRIIKVAATAIAARSRIRWFDQEEFERTGMRRGGIANMLLPMNACALRSPVVPRIEGRGVLYMLTISTENRRSLVFYAPPRRSRAHGVLFAADTALTYGWGDPWPLEAFPQMGCSRTICTAPHHGSENNAIAYDHGSKHYGVVGWLRCHSSAFPGRTFRSQAWKACTRCSPDVSSRTVEVSLLHPNAYLLKSGCRCS